MSILQHSLIQSQHSNGQHLPFLDNDNNGYKQYFSVEDEFEFNDNDNHDSAIINEFDDEDDNY